MTTAELTWPGPIQPEWNVHDEWTIAAYLKVNRMHGTEIRGVREM